MTVMTNVTEPLPPVSRATLLIAELIAVAVAVAIVISMQLSLLGGLVALLAAQIGVGLFGYLGRLFWYRVWRV